MQMRNWACLIGPIGMGLGGFARSRTVVVTLQIYLLNFIELSELCLNCYGDDDTFYLKI